MSATKVTRFREVKPSMRLPKALLLAGGLAGLIGYAAFATVELPELAAVSLVVSDEATEASSVVVVASVAGGESALTVADEQGSGPDARIAANLLRPDAPVRGPLNTAELAHLALTDQDGKRFSLADLKGDTLLVNFMFAGCSSVCPVQTIGLRRVHNELKLDPKTDRIKLVSITIAPLSDTPQQLKDFAKRFEIDQPTWRFGVASQADTDELTKQFSVGVQPLEGEQLDHRSLLYLINHEGVMIQQYRGAKVDVERLKKELRIVDALR